MAKNNKQDETENEETIVEEESLDETQKETTKDLVPPVEEGDVIEDVEVINTGKKDDGVVKYNNYIIFVNNCKKGDTVSFKVTKILPNFGIGENLKNSEEE